MRTKKIHQVHETRTGGAKTLSASDERRPQAGAGARAKQEASTMNWSKLLAPFRLRQSNSATGSGEDGRSSFHRDYDRILFSSAFRRLHGKTQVFPLPETDMTHTRLTHSIETSCVGRSLGALAGEKLSDFGVTKHDVSAIVAAACLAHDIGNPPFGHAGEDAIRDYFKNEKGKLHTQTLSDKQRADLEAYEGNAAGFRLLTHSRRAQSDIPDGLNLTMPTLAAYTKYPKTTGPQVEKNRASQKKAALLQCNLKQYEQLAETLGISKVSDGQCWHRHPLAFLVEAADDICNAIMDLEDGFKLGLVSLKRTKSLLEATMMVASKFRCPE